MLIREKDVTERFAGNADGFESLMASILREIAREVGIPSYKVLRDPRTTVGDGGRDIQVDASHTSEKKTFLPQKPSYWSVKSGETALDVAIFNSEVRTHPKVKDHLALGNVFVYCTIANCTNDQKEALQKAANKLCTELTNDLQKEISADQFVFHWNDTVTAELIRHPAVIIYHLPEHAHRVQNLRTLDEWRDNSKTKSNWVGFGDRESVKQRVVQHLISTEGNNCLHVAGLSGIGKSRLVREACEQIRIQSEGCMMALYLDHPNHLLEDRSFENYLVRTSINALIVIDEVDDQSADTIAGIVESANDRLRIVTIGPAKRQQARMSLTKIILSEPSSSDEVYSVIQQFDSLKPGVLRQIAEQSSHDLRLALFLVSVLIHDEHPELLLSGSPARMLDKIIEKFFIDGDQRLKAKLAFEKSSCFVDIGKKGTHGSELQILADLFNTDRNDLCLGISLCDEIGLSVKSSSYFEPSPRALASFVFSERIWPAVRLRLDDIFSKSPDRLLRKFLVRCHECSGHIRSEVQADLADYFRRMLQKAGVDELQDEDSARLFSTWCEFDPAAGLEWLRITIELADKSTLQNFEGDSGYGYRWGGRRYIVWLCESLSRFPEHFSDCERILWKLANNETELGIGNNSQAIWCNLFWPILTQQSLPFPERSSILINRVREKDPESVSLVIRAILEVLTPRMVGHVVPPEFVGGVLAPTPWRPSSRIELKQVVQDFGRSVLRAVGQSYEEPALEQFCGMITKQLVSFLNLDLIAEIRSLCDRVSSPEGKQQILMNVKDLNAAINERLAERVPDSIAEQVKNWEENISPTDLQSRIKYLTSRSYWDVIGDIQKKDDPYLALAREIENEPSVLPQLSAWLNSRNAESAFNLGVALGKIGSD